MSIFNTVFNYLTGKTKQRAFIYSHRCGWGNRCTFKIKETKEGFIPIVVVENRHPKETSVIMLPMYYVCKTLAGAQVHIDEAIKIHNKQRREELKQHTEVAKTIYHDYKPEEE